MRVEQAAASGGERYEAIDCYVLLSMANRSLKSTTFAFLPVGSAALSVALVTWASTLVTGDEKGKRDATATNLDAPAATCTGSIRGTTFHFGHDSGPGE